MGYSPEILTKLLGNKYDRSFDHVIETHQGAARRIAAGTHKKIGEVPDSSDDQNGTMVVLRDLAKPPPKPKPIKNIETPVAKPQVKQIVKHRPDPPAKPSTRSPSKPGMFSNPLKKDNK